MSAEIDFKTCTEEELWRFVASHLESRGIGVILVGGAVVSIYSKGAYRSGDLDFVQENVFGKPLELTLEEIGFRRSGDYFVHADCEHLFVQFVSGPLGIGENSEIVPREEPEGEYLLKILSPTDCICDRLASYIHYSARECLDQAALVAEAQEVDWQRIEAWCLGEGRGGEDAFSELKRLTGTTR